MTVSQDSEWINVTNYRSATATAGGSNTITGSFVLAEEGRAIFLHAGTGAGQINYIDSVAAGVATCKYDWDTIPDNTSEFFVSHIADDLDAVANCNKYDDKIWVITGRGVSLSTNHFLWLKEGESLTVSDPTRTPGSGTTGNGTAFRREDTGCFSMGYKIPGTRIVYGGAHLNVDQGVQFNLGSGSGTNRSYFSEVDAKIAFFDSVITKTFNTGNDQTYQFWYARCPDDATVNATEWINTNFVKSDGGMRFYGGNSFVQDFKIARNDNNLNAFTVAGDVEISGLKARDSTFGFYWSISQFEGDLLVTGADFVNMSEADVAYFPTNSAAAGYDLKFKDDQISGNLSIQRVSASVPAFLDQLNRIRTFNPTVAELDGTAIVGARVALRASGTWAQFEELTTDANGEADTDLQVEQYDLDMADGVTVSTPDRSNTGATVTVTAYGFLPQQGDIGTDPDTVTRRLFADAFTVLSEAAAGALTGFAVNHTTDVITISQSRNDSQLYDWLRWDHTQNGSIESAPYLTATAVLVDYLAYDLALSGAITLTLAKNHQTTGAITLPAGATITGGDGGIIVAAGGTFSIAGDMNAGTLEISGTATATGAGTVASATEIKTGGSLALPNNNDITGALNMTGGGLELDALTDAYQITGIGSTPTGNITFDAINSDGTLDMRGWPSDADLSGVTINHAGSGDITIRLLPGQTAPALNNTGAGSLTLDSSASVSLPNILNGSLVRFYNVTQATEIDVSTAGAGGYSFSVTSEAAGGDVIEFRIALTSGLTAYDELTIDGVFSATEGFTSPAAQTQLTNGLAYNTAGIDGSTVTECTADYPNLEIDVNDPDGTTQVQRIFAWHMDNLMTADGIRNFWNGIVCLDPSAATNYVIRTAIVDMMIDNTGATALLIDGGRLFRDDGISILKPGTNGQHDTGFITFPWTALIDGPYSAQQIMKLIGAATAGKSSGGPGSPVFRNVADTVDAITGTADDDGNRTAATYSA